MPHRASSPRTPRRVRLLCLVSTGPFTSWEPEIIFLRGAKTTEVIFTGDRMDERSRQVATLDAAATLRDYARFLVRNRKCAIWATLEDGEFYVDGARGLWAELMVMAWMHGADTEPHKIAEQLLRFDDRRLERLRKAWGPLDGQVVAALRRLWDGTRTKRGGRRASLKSVIERFASEAPSIAAIGAWLAARSARLPTSTRGTSRPKSAKGAR